MPHAPCPTFGKIGFKGPPNEVRMVEIASCVEEDQQGNGYATEAAVAAIQEARQQDDIRFSHPITQRPEVILLNCRPIAWVIMGLAVDERMDGKNK